ncbi:toxic anion resistance protein [Sandarakinorhabdus limnophila]|uniref:toxic anion resistance protein n=1 Tax=Sandarakinorhabdus limnophila TaxID=210512 RepID=UPI0003B42DDA|nr:toxic anion resistance protein [Sandarakinorhabdus limnophila]
MSEEVAIKLEPPVAVSAIAPAKAAGLVPLKDQEKAQLEAKVESFIDELIATDAASPEFGKKVDALANLGATEIARAAAQSNRFLDRPTRALNKETGIGADLVQLRKIVEDLDPGKSGKLTGRKKLFGLIPVGGNKLRSYFDSYKSAQTNINAILGALKSGKDELLKDNISIEDERAKLWDAMGKLEQMVHMSKVLDEKLEERATELDVVDPAKAKAIRENALFYVRQRTQDLLTQLAVSVQGYLALDLVKKNNVELMKGVDRASTTTVSALRTAVTVAEAMTNQKLVLEQITQLNTTTAGIIDSTGELLKSNTAMIHEQAAASTIPVETLQRAFQNVYQTMDAIDTFKMKSLEAMKTTVDTLSVEVEKSRAYVARAQGQAEAQIAGPQNNLTALT